MKRYRDITTKLFQIKPMLERPGGVTVSEIKDRVGCSKQHAKRLIDRASLFWPVSETGEGMPYSPYYYKIER